MALPVVPLVYGGLAAYQYISGINQADAVEAQLKRQRRIDLENADLAEFDAWAAEAFGQTQIARYQQTLDQAEGTAKVSAAANGATISGSLAEVVDQNQYTGYLNQLDIENQAVERGLGYRRQARGIREQSQLNYNAGMARSQSMRNAALINIGTTALQGYAAQSSLSKLSADSGYSATSGGVNNPLQSVDDDQYYMMMS